MEVTYQTSKKIKVQEWKHGYIMRSSDSDPDKHAVKLKKVVLHTTERDLQ